jgi:N-glycosylase/DNA lyase
MMNQLELPNYNLSWTLLGGQSLNWDFDPKTETFYGYTRNGLITLRQKGDILYWQTYPEKDNLELLKKYLRLNVDYADILQDIGRDEHIKKAMQAFPDLRLLKQDFEEALLTFILTPQKTIKITRSNIRSMSKALGEKIELDGKTHYLFPTTKAIAQASLEELKSFGFGFRAQNIKLAAQKLLEENLSAEIVDLDVEAARNKLKEFRGVGDKVADCVLIYGLGHDTVIPLDVWGLKIAHEIYGLDPKDKYENKRKWLVNYLGSHASWAGQFLFEYIRGFRPEDYIVE